MQGERFLREEMRALPDGGTYSAVVLGAEADAVLQGRQQVVLPLPKAMQVCRRAGACRQK